MSPAVLFATDVSIKLMVSVTFRQPGAGQDTIEIDAGISLMEGAVRSRITGIEARCGGALSCATCHVWIDRSWSEKLPAPSEAELDILELAAGRASNSRLSCQIRVDHSMEGLVVTVPAAWRP